MQMGEFKNRIGMLGEHARGIKYRYGPRMGNTRNAIDAAVHQEKHR